MTAPQKRVYVHIGLPHSGALVVQTGLARNQRALLEAGIQCPDSGERPALDVCGNHKAWGRTRSEVEGCWDKLSLEAHRHNGTTVISQELLAAASKRRVASALSMLHGLDVHVVVTAGDLARQIRGAWQAEVRLGLHSSFEEYLRRIMSETHDRETAQMCWTAQDLPDVLSRWASRLTARNVHVVSRPREDVELWRLFGDVVGFDADAFLPPPSGPSASLTGAPFPVQVYDDLVTIAERWTKEIDKAGYPVHGDLDDLVPTVHPTAT